MLPQAEKFKDMSKLIWFAPMNTPIATVQPLQLFLYQRGQHLELK